MIWWDGHLARHCQIDRLEACPPIEVCNYAVFQGG